MRTLMHIRFGRLVKCRACGTLVRGPNYCQECGEPLIYRAALLALALHCLTLALLLSALIAGALALPAARPVAACSAAGHCHKAESPAAMRR